MCGIAISSGAMRAAAMPGTECVPWQGMGDLQDSSSQSEVLNHGEHHVFPNTLPQLHVKRETHGIRRKPMGEYGLHKKKNPALTLCLTHVLTPSLTPRLAHIETLH